MSVHLKATGPTTATLCGVEAGSYFTTEPAKVRECAVCAAAVRPAYGELDFPAVVVSDNGQAFRFSGMTAEGHGMYGGMAGYSFRLDEAWRCSV